MDSADNSCMLVQIAHGWFHGGLFEATAPAHSSGEMEASIVMYSLLAMCTW